MRWKDSSILTSQRSNICLGVAGVPCHPISFVELPYARLSETTECNVEASFCRYDEMWRGEVFSGLLAKGAG